MTIAKWLNMAGLVLGMAGVVVIFIWGPPQPTFDEDPHEIPGLPPTPHSIAAARREGRLKRRHQLMSSIGLALVFLGFAVQFAAVLETP
jgi:uncharacterized membrane protein